MIVVGGDNLIDLIESARNDGAVSFVGARGGSGYNTARAAVRQDQSVGFITPIATDNLGHFLIFGTNSKPKCGLMPKHAFSVLDFFPLYNTKRTQILHYMTIIRDPYGPEAVSKPDTKFNVTDTLSWN